MLSSCKRRNLWYILCKASFVSVDFVCRVLTGKDGKQAILVKFNGSVISYLNAPSLPRFINLICLFYFLRDRKEIFKAKYNLKDVIITKKVWEGVGKLFTRWNKGSFHYAKCTTIFVTDLYQSMVYSVSYYMLWATGSLSGYKD